jgi:ketosteroid isomerase-like protein
LSGLVDNDWAMVFTLRNGKIARFRNFEETAAETVAHAHP